VEIAKAARFVHDRFPRLGPGICEGRQTPYLHFRSQGRGSGHGFGKGTVPVTKGFSLPADAVAFCARSKIALTALWYASMWSSVVGR
jgi:hypothetical protein